MYRLASLWPATFSPTGYIWPTHALLKEAADRLACIYARCSNKAIMLNFMLA